jgi:predicted AAA+ superfamily ATPase
MSYIKRHLEDAMRRMEKMFAVLLVSGARQTGKTRLLRELYPHLTYVSLDDAGQYQEAAFNPGGFFNKYSPPLVVDEVQYAPNLFPYIKLIADGVITNGVHAETAAQITGPHKGLFFMSGSQQYLLMKNVSESLVGRIGILNLYGLSRREIFGQSFNKPFLPVDEYYRERKPGAVYQSYDKLWEAIHRGSYPELQNSEIDRESFYSAYVKTYIERDVRQLVNVGDELSFYQFMTAMAARNGQLLNYASIAEDIGLSLPTIKRWTSILLASNVIFLLQPYHTNMLKRAVRTPKLYFLDSGLVCFLSRWNTPEALERGAAAGAVFESYCIAEIIKSYANAGRDPSLYFYRDKEKNEIDLLIHENATLYPVEIKKYTDPRPDDTKAFKCIEKIPGLTRGSGGILCLCDRPLMLGEKDTAIPLGYI